MKTACCNVLALLALSVVPVHAEECKPVHADLVEVFSTEGCNPVLSYCYLGVVDGNHGLRGTTHFRGNSSGTAPSGLAATTFVATVFSSLRRQSRAFRAVSAAGSRLALSRYALRK